MMTQKSHPSLRRGFTLIELLVVISIVAVLAAMSFAGVTAAMKKTRTVQSQTLATGLEKAVNDFYNDYNRLPDFTQDEIKTDTSQGEDLLKILMAEEDGQRDLDNSRKNRYFDPQEGKGNKGGVIRSKTGDRGPKALFDAFGNPFTVVLNLDYEDELRFSMGGKQYRLRGKQVAVYSPGADGEEGTSDDVVTFTKQN
ncbi:prepilin-type N-terminal cleavage/methylation domain-containing protein [Haloferula luteola]|uniref:Prepilin-type N-terminal cleavage/methylation domain-containing protein n=1 Tax=Haloferula luteola TaxID=595692 RepID=A0A840UW03_9BACT|nr:type II secretion system protein [Haloferula luteola]MBB5349905.1 prepilin-type N-terminal cleavage/methylation domain-containing protein [Haloferula luteola]